jgi:uncharacterized membrane protein
MAHDQNQDGNQGDGESTTFATIRRAFGEFLWLPSAVIVGFFLLAAGVYLLDRAGWSWLQPVSNFLRAHIFTDVPATQAFLGTTATGLMTVTSVTISVLLLALQQSANAMTTAVFDQFLRRRHNQFYFGFFVGLTLYTLIVLATVNAPFNPVISAAIGFCLTVVALFLLIVLLYTTINQMRPVEIIGTIHHHILAARRRQRQLLAATRRRPQYRGAVQRPVRAVRRGTVSAIAVETITSAVQATGVDVEVALAVSIGDHVAFHDLIATVHGQTEMAAAAVGEAVERAVKLDRERDITTDPGYGIEQLTIIAWSSISSAKSDLGPGLLTVYSLRDILARWSLAEKEVESATEKKPAPVVYEDNTFGQLLNALESLAVVSSESMQHQIFAEVLHTFARLFDQFPPAQQQQAETILLRLLTALGDHVLTTRLDIALSTLLETLQNANRTETAQAVQNAQGTLRRSLGALQSRVTRAEDVVPNTK